jgi:MoxR-like ATPase
MVRAFSKVMDLSFKRIQFTPDLMPSDITGTNVIDESSGKRDFRFIPGPIFAHIVLADEINRTPPKTQAALLEAMQERQVSVGQTTYQLPRPFFVIATQNPIEQEGTYPLPEAQLDRFMFNIHVDYPGEEEEQAILEATTSGRTVKHKQLFTAAQILEFQELVESIAVPKFVIQYVAKLVRATRPRAKEAPEFVRTLVDWGAGPRAGQNLIFGAKAVAAMAGRVNAGISDVKQCAVPVMRHRIGLNFQAQAEGITTVDITNKLLAAVPEPAVEKFEAR